MRWSLLVIYCYFMIFSALVDKIFLVFCFSGFLNFMKTEKKQSISKAADWNDKNNQNKSAAPRFEKKSVCRKLFLWIESLNLSIL